MKQLFIIISLLFAETTIHGQTNFIVASKSVDTLIEQSMKRLNIPGIAVAVIKSGKVIKQSTYGFANLEWNNKVTEHTNFQIASCTKLLTSTLLLKALKEKKIQLTDYVEQYLDSVPTTWKGLQIKHLITHSSGLREFRGDYYITTDAVVKAIKDSALEYNIGKGQHYAQIDFMLLGYIMEQIYKKPLTTILKDEITTPLDMNDGGYDMEQKAGSLMRTTLIKEKATTYYDIAGKTVSYKFMYPNYYYTAGGYFASITDIANWAAGLDNEILFSRNFADTYLYGRDSIGNKLSAYTKAGWILENENGITYAGHSGGPGLADILRFPKEGYTFIVLANDGELLPTFARAIASYYINGLPLKSNITKFDR